MDGHFGKPVFAHEIAQLGLIEVRPGADRVVEQLLLTTLRWNAWKPLVMSSMFVPRSQLLRSVPVRESSRRLMGLSAIEPPLQKRLPNAHSLPSLSTRRNIGMRARIVAQAARPSR